jgi:hypothetical protein
VPHPTLDGVNIDTVFHQVRSEAVPQYVDASHVAYAADAQSLVIDPLRRADADVLVALTRGEEVLGRVFGAPEILQ